MHSIKLYLIKLSALILFSLYLFSCSIKRDEKQEAFKILIPDSSLHKPNNEISISRLRADEFNLPYLNDGVDSFELRIWQTSIVNPKKLVVLRNCKKMWAGYTYDYYVENGSVDSFVVKKINTPDSIKEIQSFLIRKDILELPSQKDIPEFNDNIADGQFLTLEFATKDFYKSLTYHCPESFADKDNRKFVEAIRYLDNYFHFYSPLCPPIK